MRAITFEEPKIQTTGIVLSILLVMLSMLFTLKASAQCGVGPNNCYTYEETLSQFTSGNTKIVGIDVDTDANYSFSSGEMLLIPSGVNYSANVSNSNVSNVICIAPGGTYSGGMGNQNLILRNYSTNTLNIPQNFAGSIENYGGTIINNEISNLGSSQYILNCNGTINWNKSLNINSGASLYNAGLFNLDGQWSEMSGNGCIQNEAWLRVKKYNGSNNILNNGKIEVLETDFYINGGTVINNCAFFTAAVGAKFHVNTNILNNGLIYLPSGEFKNYGNYIFTNEDKGVVRSSSFYNESTITGSGWFYITGNSQNVNSGIFGQGSDDINFYDASPGGATGSFDVVHNVNNIGGYITFNQFPEPEYSPDLSNYECGDIILAGSVQPGEIAASQVLCDDIAPQPFTSVQDAWVDDVGAIITYQWQSSTDNVNFYSISGANQNVYTVPSRPAAITYYRRRAKATYSGADSIKNAMNNSNVLTITPVDDPPPSITVNPSNTSVCYNTQAQFTAAAQNTDSYLWQVLSTEPEAEWTDLSDVSPYSGSTTGTLTINPVATGMNNYQYRLAATSNYCGTVYSSPATLSVLAADKPSITQQPNDQMLCPGTTSATFETTGSTAGLSYQWEISTDGGTTWTNITGENYSGSTTYQLTVNESGLNEDHLYRCVLNAVCDTAITHSVRIYQVEPEVKVSSTPEIKCPDIETELGFNGLDNDYRMGNSRVVFVVQRLSEGPFDWTFSYDLTLTNPALLAENPPQTTNATINVNSTDNEYILIFYLENQTEDAVILTLNLSEVSVEGCTENSAENSNHSATTTVKRMPAVGAFNSF